MRELVSFHLLTFESFVLKVQNGLRTHGTTIILTIKQLYTKTDLRNAYLSQ